MNRFFILVTLLMCLSCSQKLAGNWQGGVDDNSNGIRDDIDTWIKSKAGDNIRLKLGLEKLARINPARCDYSVAAKCIDQLSEDSIMLQIELLDLQLNTDKLRKNFEDNVKNCPRIDDRNISYKCNL